MGVTGGRLIPYIVDKWECTFFVGGHGVYVGMGGGDC